MEFHHAYFTSLRRKLSLIMVRSLFERDERTGSIDGRLELAAKTVLGLRNRGWENSNCGPDSSFAVAVTAGRPSNGRLGKVIAPRNHLTRALWAGSARFATIQDLSFFEECTQSRDRRGGVLIHQPMTGIRNHARTNIYRDGFANVAMSGANDFSPPIANTGIRRGALANVASSLASASKSLKYVKPTRMVPGCA